MCFRYSTRFARRRVLDARTAGFSLIEVMVVLVIIGLLAGVVGINVKSHIDTGRVRKAGADIGVLAAQVKIFYAHNGRYPTTSEGLPALVPKYIEKLSKDPWGNDYQYDVPGRGGAFDIISFGADGREGGEEVEADISNWDLGDADA